MQKLNSGSDGFLKNVSRAINRTWVHSDWDSICTQDRDSNNCEHLSDKFWTLGIGNINCTGQYSGSTYFQDQNYDTSKFASIFNPSVDLNVSNTPRIKYIMSTDGTTGSSAVHWWLRSAYSNDDCDVGGVNGDGYIDISRADGNLAAACRFNRLSDSANRSAQPNAKTSLQSQVFCCTPLVCAKRTSVQRYKI